MPWNRNDPDPLEIKRRQLADQERRLALKMSRLTSELQQAGEPSTPDPKTLPPPVWRMEDEPVVRPIPEPASTRKVVLARQRQRDMILFFGCILLLLLAIAFFCWLFYTHYAPSTQGP